MKAKEKDALKAKSPQELSAELHKTREQYHKMRFRHQSAPLKNPLELRSLRRHVARLETLLNAPKPAEKAKAAAKAGK